jgi:hypothetical protein
VSWVFDVLGLAGLVFIGLCIWLVRKVFKAAGTEGDLEAERLQSALAGEMAGARARRKAEQDQGQDQDHVPDPDPVRAPPDALSGADLSGLNPAHLPLIATMVAEREKTARAQYKGPSDVPRRIEVLWARSNATHAVWCERRHAATLAARAMTRDVICVALIERGRVTERWFFG